MANKINFWITYCKTIKEIAVCDCFIDMTVGLIHDGIFSLDKNSQDRVIKHAIRREQIDEEVYVLIGELSVFVVRKLFFNLIYKNLFLKKN